MGHTKRVSFGGAIVSACALALCLGLPATAHADDAAEAIDPDASAQVTLAETAPESVYEESDTYSSSGSIEYHRGESWELRNGHWYYRMASGEYVTNRVASIGGEIYIFDDAGRMVTGWFSAKSNDGTTLWTYAYSTGQIANGWQKLGGSWYYFNHSLRNPYVTLGCEYINGNYYYFNSSGQMQTGWVSYRYIGEQVWSYACSSGELVKGWQQLGGSWFYFSTGRPYAMTGVQKLGDNYYAFDNSGRMRTGWISTNPWSYASSTGSFLTGWQKLGGSWYYFRTDWSRYPCATGSVTLDGNHYTFSRGGKWTGR